MTPIGSGCPIRKTSPGFSISSNTPKRNNRHDSVVRGSNEMNRQLIDGMAASLRALARRGGDDAIKDPRRVRGKLADDHPENMAGRSTVLAALEIGVPERLKEADPQLIGAAMRRETVLLQTKFG